MTIETKIPTGQDICLCAVCREMMKDSEVASERPGAQRPVFKCGELSYIELAHKHCAVRHRVEEGYPWELEGEESLLDECQGHEYPIAGVMVNGAPAMGTEHCRGRCKDLPALTEHPIAPDCKGHLFPGPDGTDDWAFCEGQPRCLS